MPALLQKQDDCAIPALDVLRQAFRPATAISGSIGTNLEVRCCHCAPTGFLEDFPQVGNLLRGHYPCLAVMRKNRHTLLRRVGGSAIALKRQCPLFLFFLTPH
jgi:hypothetical protein